MGKFLNILPIYVGFFQFFRHIFKPMSEFLDFSDIEISYILLLNLSFFELTYVNIQYKQKVEHFMKKTIANTNKYFTNAKSKEKMIVNSVYTSAKVEGSKTTKKELKEHYRLIHS